MITVQEAVVIAKKWIEGGNRIGSRSVSAESEANLARGEYRVEFKSGQVVHVDAGNGVVMEPENGYLVCRR